MQRTILFVILVCLCYGSLASSYSQTRRKQPSPQPKASNPQPAEQVNKPSSTPHAQGPPVKSTSPDNVAQAMVKALKDNHLVGGIGFMDLLQLNADEKNALGSAPGEAFFISLETTGESLTDQQKLQGVMIWGGLFMSRRPLTPEKVANYLSRFRAIDKTTVDKWRTALSNSDEPGKSLSIMLSWLAFHDFLFEGGQWKKGQPDKAIARLSSLTKDAVSRWKVAVGKDDEAYGAWSLLAVDSLFVNDTFQQAVFDAAFPIAQKLLSAR